MRIDLPSGAWVDIRDKLTADDRFAVQDAIQIDLEVADNGQAGTLRRISGGNVDKMRKALLGRVITGWSFAEQGMPIPSQNQAGAEIIGTLDIDDYGILADAVQPLMDKANPNLGRRPNPAPSPS